VERLILAGMPNLWPRGSGRLSCSTAQEPWATPARSSHTISQ